MRHFAGYFMGDEVIMPDNYVNIYAHMIHKDWKYITVHSCFMLFLLFDFYKLQLCSTRAYNGGDISRQLELDYLRKRMW